MVTRFIFLSHLAAPGREEPFNKGRNGARDSASLTYRLMCHYEMWNEIAFRYWTARTARGHMGLRMGARKRIRSGSY